MMINDILNDKFDVNDKKREIKTMINLIKMIKKTPGMTNAWHYGLDTGQEEENIDDNKWYKQW